MTRLAGALQRPCTFFYRKQSAILSRQLHQNALVEGEAETRQSFYFPGRFLLRTINNILIIIRPLMFSPAVS